MTSPTEGRSVKRIGLIVAAALVVVALYGGLKFFSPPQPEPALVEQATPAEKTTMAVDTPMVVDVGRLESDAKLKQLMASRKEDYGAAGGLTAIVKPDETIQVGDTKVSMKEILEKIRLHKGDVIETDISGAPQVALEEYGIYPVQPGDNIWNIHFRFLKDYLSHRGVAVTPMADEPGSGGLSSGVGKLLKFSEKIVYIYNVKTRKLEVDLDRIQPMTKIVVYNMKEVFALLDQIDYDRVNRIEFDGDTIWIPAEQ